MTNLSNTCRITKDGVFVYSGNDHLSAEEISMYIAQNKVDTKNKYLRNFNYYCGKHPILHNPPKPSGRPDHRIVSGIAHYIVDTYNGYFMGVSPKIFLQDKKQNEPLQDWLNGNNFVDKLSQVSKDVDIYGKAFMFVYQNEDAKTKVAVTDPTDSFVVYDDEITPHIMAYIRYWTDNDGNNVADVYYADRMDHFVADSVETVKDYNVFKAVPAIEFYESSERMGVFEGEISEIDELDNALSQKANQVDYFDNAYLAILGLNLGDGAEKLNIGGNQLIYSPDASAANAKVEFLTKPDGDNMQENILNRISDEIYQNSQIPNLRDKEFSGNSSGVALAYKLLPMQNKASNKEHQFTHGLRSLFKILFKVDTIINDQDAYNDLIFKFYRNVPQDFESDASVAKDLHGIVSDKTLYTILPFINDPDDEIKQVQKEQEDSVNKMKERNADLLSDSNNDPLNESDNEDQPA